MPEEYMREDRKKEKSKMKTGNATMFRSALACACAFLSFAPCTLAAAQGRHTTLRSFCGFKPGEEQSKMKLRKSVLAGDDGVFRARRPFRRFRDVKFVWRENDGGKLEVEGVVAFAYIDGTKKFDAVKKEVEACCRELSAFGITFGEKQENEPEVSREGHGPGIASLLVTGQLKKRYDEKRGKEIDSALYSIELAWDLGSGPSAEARPPKDKHAAANDDERRQAALSPVKPGDFKATITGVAVVDASERGGRNVKFLPPETPLVVPYGKFALFRVEYDIPEGYGAQLWALSTVHQGYFGSSGSKPHSGKGVAYPWFGLLGSGSECTIEKVKIDTRSHPKLDGHRQEWTIGTTSVNLTFKEIDVKAEAEKRRRLNGGVDLPSAKSSDFKATITGVAVVEHSMRGEDKDKSDVKFLPPETPLVVPYGKTALFRVEYDFPKGYNARVWVRDGLGDDGKSHSRNFGSNPSGGYKGRGVAYGWFCMMESGTECTIATVKIKTRANPEPDDHPKEWIIGTTPVKLTFRDKGSSVAAENK